MNVRELIAALQEMDPEKPVHFIYNYGDHWRTTVAPLVDSVTDGYVTHSAYHNMPKMVDVDEDEEELQSDKSTEAVLIRG